MNHVLSFNTAIDNEPNVRLPDVGSSGTQAKASAVVDANGEVVGLRVLERGKYFFGSSTSSNEIHSDFEKVKIDLDDGSILSAKIIWQEDNTTGSYFISGFESLEVESGQNSYTSSHPKIGDTFSFATGTKTFLDHRDSNGNLLNVSYLGGNESSRTAVGTSADVSLLLDASGGSTKQLGDVVNSLIDLQKPSYSIFL